MANFIKEFERRKEEEENIKREEEVKIKRVDEEKRKSTKETKPKDWLIEHEEVIKKQKELKPEIDKRIEN